MTVSKEIDDVDQYMDDQNDMVKLLNKQQEDDSEEEEQDGTFEIDYQIYKNQGESFASLLQLVQARLNRI